MDQQTLERRVYHGAPVKGTYRISAIKFSKFRPGEKFRTTQVANLSSYESGCHKHRRCFGHMCATPSGIILPPQSMSMRTMEIATEYNIASKMAFGGDKNAYLERLRSTNYTKRGTYRIIMSTPVAGSARLIATPQWEFGREYIAISENLASRMKVCKIVYDENGNAEGKYVEDSLKEGDWVLVVRPPSLHFGNTQPMRIKFWNKDCIGIHPGSFSMFHGDFDGDEAHIYPVYDTQSISECESWDVLPFGDFEIGNNLFEETMTIVNERPEKLQGIPEDRARFIEYTTISANQISSGPPCLVLGQQSRNKKRHIDGMHDRFESPSTEDSFVAESIRGMNDVMKQQLSQGNLGDMTRVAKIAASCFYRPSEGSLYIKARSGSYMLIDDKLKDEGTPSIRAVSNLCRVAQQAALDSHRANSKEGSTHDFISDLILGCYRKIHKSATSEYTFIQLSKNSVVYGSIALLREKKLTKWTYDDGRSISMLIKPADVRSDLRSHILAAYNPEVLHLAEKAGKDLADICACGIRVICNYYSLDMSPVELIDIVAVFTYKVSASFNPITTRQGMMSRMLGWIETFEATDYTKLPTLEGNYETPDTTTAAMFMANFDNLKAKHF